MKVLNFGSLNVDYVYNLPHILKPGETLTSTGRNVFAGGKGLNQSVALAKAGAEVFHAGKVGYDGDILIKALKEGKVNTNYVVLDKEKESGHTFIQVDSNAQNCIMVHPGTNRTHTTEYIDNTLKHFTEGDFLVLQNEVNNLRYIMDKAYDMGMKIVLNPSPIDDSLNYLPVEKVSYLVINEIEGAQIAGTEEIKEIIPNIARKYPNTKILLTLGCDGSVYFDGKNTYKQEIYKVKAVDTTAAGDTFLGYFVAGLCEGLQPTELLKLCAKASSITVSKLGAAGSIPFRSEVG